MNFSPGSRSSCSVCHCRRAGFRDSRPTSGSSMRASLKASTTAAMANAPPSRSYRLASDMMRGSSCVTRGRGSGLSPIRMYVTPGPMPKGTPHPMPSIPHPDRRVRRLLTTLFLAASPAANANVAGPRRCHASERSRSPCATATHERVSPQAGQGRPMTRLIRHSRGPRSTNEIGVIAAAASAATTRRSPSAMRARARSSRCSQRRSGRPFASGTRPITSRMRSMSAQMPHPPSVMSLRIPRPV